MMRSALLASALMLCWLPGNETALANPCSDPMRVVQGYTVDLRPLLDWWREPKGTRPLSGWKHARGSILRDIPSGWVINGKAEGLGATTFFLRNPPRQKFARFQELQRQLPDYERARDEVRAFVSRPVVTDMYSLYLTQWAAPPISLPEYREANSRLGELNQKVDAIRTELASMQDDQGNFRLDVFALKLKESFEGLPVVDYGLSQPFGDSGAATAPRRS
jgi:hypothetical protein